MNNDVTIDLSTVKPVEFSYNESDMTAGFVAQEIGTLYPNTVTLSSGISITTTGIAAGNSYTMSSSYDDMIEKLSDRLEKLEKLVAEEEQVRKNHPAVLLAYEEYQFLYVLAKKNAGDLLTTE